MFLKKIEMENFKSFGKKTVVEFRKGYTSITGPNASGKSNIGDALLFVLGTKSNKSLRAQKLTDLIHRNNSGRLSPYLKASVTFDNSDKSIPLESNEVTFSRIVKLSENNDDYSSYYFINDDRARLQDFEYLLEKAKIFADGYNFVRQGDITSIVEMTPVERRGILEEVGGIAVYNQEIEKTGDDRNKVQENMVTVMALVTEISTRVNILSKEKDQAESYLNKKHEIDKLEGIIKYRKKSDIENEISTINDQVGKIKVDIENTENAIKNLSVRNTEIEQKLKEMEKDSKELEEFQRIKNDLDSKKIQYSKKSMELENMEDKVKNNSIEIDQLKTKRKSMETEFKSLSKKLSELESAVKNEKNKLIEAEKTLEDLENSSRSTLEKNVEIGKKIDSLVAQKESLLLSIKEHSTMLASLETKGNNLLEEIAKTEEEIGALEFSIKDTEWRLKNISKGDNGSDQWKKRYLEIKNRTTSIRKEEEDLSREIEKLEGEAGKMQGARLSGIWESINYIMSEASKGNLPGIRGTVDSLISYSPEHEKAVRAAGGNRLMSIVVDTDEDAQQAIESLKKRQKGRMTFLPLNKIIPMRAKGKALMLSQDKKTLGLLINNVKYDPVYDSVVSYVFSDTLLVPTIAVAREIMGGVRIVTLDGDLIDPSNAMTGGTLGKREVEKDLESISTKLSNLKNKRKELRNELSDLEEELKSITEKINKANLEVGKGEGVSVQLSERKRELEDQLRKKRDYLTGKKKLLQLNKEDIVREKSSLSDENTKVTRLSTDLDKLTKERESVLDKETKGKIAKSRELVTSLKNTLENSTNELNEMKVNTASVKSAINSNIDAITKLENENTDITARKKRIDEELAQIKNEISAITSIFEAMESKLKEKGKEIEKLNNEKFKVRSEMDSKSTIKKTKFDFMLSLQGKASDAEQRLKEIVKEIEEKNVEFADDQRTIEEIRKDISGLENELKLLEPVNLKSIDDYKEESSRLQELTQKKEQLDLEMSKLNELEKKLEDQKKIVFLDVFQKVNANYIEIYKELTNGGEGYLYLENPTNPFEGGLFVKASSKGKKVDNLASLSGGEKSLAALSFIIAIQEYDPSPIYFMDEVDMFLDGVNAENVGRMFRRNSDSAQIIAVTLRKSTMKYAHQAIGVTYQDRSSMVVTKEMQVEEQVVP